MAKKTCPECGKTKDLLADFGYRHNEETREAYPKDEYPQFHYFQPWCTPCRSLKGQESKAAKRKMIAYVSRIAKNVPMLAKFYQKKTGDTKKRSKAFMLEKLGV